MSTRDTSLARATGLIFYHIWRETEVDLGFSEAGGWLIQGTNLLGGDVLQHANMLELAGLEA